MQLRQVSCLLSLDSLHGLSPVTGVDLTVDTVLHRLLLLQVCCANNLVKKDRFSAASGDREEPQGPTRDSARVTTACEPQTSPALAREHATCLVQEMGRH